MRILVVEVVLACVLCATGVARADDAQPKQPWAIDVTEEAKATARKHLDAGNALFLERKYLEALGEYENAIAAWNHPAIRFNMVRCRIFLGQALEASDNLELALRYGAAPFDETIYSEALAYRTLLASRIGEIEIECKQPGVQLTLNGKAIAPCPGKQMQRVLPGKLQIVGTRKGFLIRTEHVTVIGGQRERVVITLDPLSKAARITHRWRTWVPWTTFGTGLAVAGVGGLLELQARLNLSSHNDVVDNSCRTGCPTSQFETSARDRSLLQDKIAIGIVAVGLAGAATGITMVYLNRGRVVYDVSPTQGGGLVTVGRAF